MTIIEWREMVDAGLIEVDENGEEVKETSYEIDYDPSYTAHKVVD